MKDSVNGQNDLTRVNCMKCAHYYVTWEKKYPRGCRAYEFKSRQFPSLIVFQSSGMPCMKFKTKEGK